jgi:hypothetical protein
MLVLADHPMNHGSVFALTKKDLLAAIHANMFITNPVTIG